MIYVASGEDRHALDPLLENMLREHPNAHRLHAAWQGVRRFIDEARVPIMHQPDAAALLLAKALDACGLTDDARSLAARAPSAMPLHGCLPFQHLSIATLCALASGDLRIVPTSDLAPGLTVVLDLAHLRSGIECELDFVAIPVLFRLVRDAVHILNAQSQPGLIIAREKCVMTRSLRVARARRALLERRFHELNSGRCHRLIWTQ
jgi:hypothetical protein